MKAILSLSLRSLVNRRATALLTVLAIGMSTALLLGVEKIRTEAKASFASTISGTDLIIGARSGSIQLLLYSVFRIGNATNNISWSSYQRVVNNPNVAWTVPISLGDSHRGFRVMGTTQAYFDHYRHGPKRSLKFADGQRFDDLFDAVVGADVARELNYQIGDKIVIAHGLGAESFQEHDDKPFVVAGILEKTGTPVDRTVHVSLRAIEAIHVDWNSGGRTPGMAVTVDEVRQMTLRPKAITAAMVGLKSKFAIFEVQRAVNQDRREPLLAILPGVALQELWDLMGTAEKALFAISIMVVVTGLLSMLIMLLAGLGERRREMAILRSVGARPQHIFALLIGEAAVLTVVGVLLGLATLYSALAIAQPIIQETYGLFIPLTPPSATDFTLLAMIIGAGLIAGAVPAWKASRQALADGLVVRV